jgi:hypothetical protein
MKIIRINPNSLIHVAIVAPIVGIAVVGAVETWSWLKLKFHKK